MVAPAAGRDEAPRVVVLGAGPGGYPAAFLAAARGMDVTLVDPEAQPGGVCLYRGCIPSKALLHVARLLRETERAGDWGVHFERPAIDLDALRGWKQRVVARLTGGLETLGRQRGVQYVQGRGRFMDASRLRISSDHELTELGFDHAIVATGSRTVIPEALRLDSPRLMDSTAALELEDIPQSLLVVGGGYIGLELGSVYAALGSAVTVVEMTDGLLPGVDRDLVAVLERELRGQLHELLLNTRVTGVEEAEGGIRVRLSGSDLEAEQRLYSKVLVAVGRTPNAEALALDHTAARLDERGFIVTDEQRRTAERSVFAVGDVAGEPMLAHKATHEARVAVEAIAGEPAAFEPAAIPAVVFTDPEIAWCGLGEAEARQQGLEIEVTKFPWAASGRAVTLGRTDGLTKLIMERGTQRLLGAGIAGPGAGELIAEATLAIEMGARASDLELTIHAHPTLSETLMEASALLFDASPHFIARGGRR